MENKPVVVLATHKRVAITTINVDLLLQQDAHVVIVASDPSEIMSFIKRYAGKKVSVLLADNEPLGKKWQAGVNYAKGLEHTHLIIVGSDDILSRNFVKTSCEAGYQVLGLQQWFIYNPTNGELYLFLYKAAQPLGGGRCYHHKFLEDIDYKLFPVGAAKWLDDQGWAASEGYHRLQYYGHDAMSILAVKGDWPVMNPLEKTFGHKNAELLRTFTGDDARKVLNQTFNYNP